MSILISGCFNTDQKHELISISEKTLIEKFQKEKYDNIKSHIVLGDGGFLSQEHYNFNNNTYRVLSERPFPVFCVLGNNDLIFKEKNLQETDIGIGETVYQYKSKPFIAYLKHGKAYTIDSIKFLVLPGALAMYTPTNNFNKALWGLEYWPDNEKQELVNLVETQNTFDCVISHFPPYHIHKKLFSRNMVIYPAHNDEDLLFLNEKILNKITFPEWWSNHDENDQYSWDNEENRGYQFLHRTAKILEKVNNKLVIYNEYGKTER